MLLLFETLVDIVAEEALDDVVIVNANADEFQIVATPFATSSSKSPHTIVFPMAEEFETDVKAVVKLLC